MKSSLPLIAACLSAGCLSLASAQDGPGSYWLRSYGLLPSEWDIDHDGDGETAREEYASGTDPFDTNSYLQLNITPDPPDVLLQWDSVLGATYSLLCSEDMTSFTPFLENIPGNGFQLEQRLATESQCNFYQLASLDPLDIDGDGLSAIEEALLGTDPRISDTDRDSIPDGAEVYRYGTDPTVPSATGGTISGTLFVEPNDDGDLTDGQPIDNTEVYLDANYNGRLDPGERTELTKPDGTYRFRFVPPGVHHVRQVLTAPNVQTFPATGRAPTFDMLPDEVVNYTHAAAGVGNFDVPYGENASESPGDWATLDPIPGINAEPVSPDVVLQPIGVRAVSPPLGSYNSNEFLTLPTGANITVRFDEMIVDGPGPDLLIYSISGSSAPEAEEAQIFVGSSESDLVYLENRFQSEGVIAIDLANFSVPGPVRYVKILSLNNQGAWMGFELVGLEAVNIASPDPDAHVVAVTDREVFAGRDFGRYARDLPPTLILGVEDDVPGTPGTRVGESATVQVRAFDDLGGVSVTLSINGSAASLDANNRASFVPANPGNVHLLATATDSGGQTVTKSTRVYVLNADGSLPFVPGQIGLSEPGGSGTPEVRILAPGAGTVSADDLVIIADIIGSPAVNSWAVEYAPVDAIDPYNLSASDADYVEIARGSGNIYSSPVATLPLSALPDGIYLVRVRGGTTYYGQVVAKNVDGAALRPQIAIDSPSPGDQVMVSVDIEGTITSGRPLREWFVEIANADQVDPRNINAPGVAWRRLASGTGMIDTSAVLASLDTTTLKNDSYIARVVAWNDIGLGWAEPVELEVTGEVKLGRNRLSFTDVSIELAGFPLQFTRIYDSLQADENGELGYGWTLALQDADIRETVPDTGVSDFFGSTPFRDGTRVYITAPSGERLGFTFRAEFGAASLLGAVYKAVFEADPGVYHTLEVPEGDRPFLTLKSDGAVYAFFINLPYNPSQYVLTDPSGRRYSYHEDEGFLQAEDPNGNTITLSANEILHSAGSRILFGRDGQGRIETITSPDGRQWTFGYDAAGDLTTTTDPEGRTMTFSYLADPAHYLESIADPLGRLPVRCEYDPVSGRLVATIDEHGNRKENTWDPGSFTGSVKTPRGFVTELVYNERGNVVQETSPLGNVTAYAYADPANPDRETSITTPEGDTWNLKYDARGNLIETRPPLSSPASTTYNSFGQVTSSVDLTGVASTFTYDERGNLLRQRGDILPQFDVEYSPEGLPVSFLESNIIANNVHKMFISYDENGNLAGVSDTSGFQASLVTDRDGNLESLTDTNGTTSTFAFDSRRLPTNQTNGVGGMITLTENPDGSMTTRDPNGLETSVKMDAAGNDTEITMPGGGLVKIDYDPSGNPATVTDPTGNTFTYTYDPEERLTALADAAGSTQQFEYNSLGLISAATTASGKCRTFEYNANLQLVAEKWHAPDDSVIRTFAYTYLGGRRLLSVAETAAGETHTHTFTGPTQAINNVITKYSGQIRFQLDYTWDRAGRGPLVPASVSLSSPDLGFFPISNIRATYIGDKSYKYSWGFGGLNSGKDVLLERNHDGTIKSLERKINFSTTHSRTRYTYAPSGPITSIRHENAAGSLIHPDADLTYVRDLGNRITSIQQASDETSVTYDAMGRVAAVDHTNAAVTDETYAYDAAGNRLSSHLLGGIGTVTPGNRLTAIGAFALAYDTDGNLAKRTDSASGEVTNFAYDHRNRLVSATVHPSEGAPAATTVNLAYDFLDRLVSRETNGAKTWILYDRSMPYAEFADGATAVSKLYLYSLDRTDDFHAVWHAGGNESWFMKDNLGSVRGVLDKTGAPVSWIDYDAYGNIQGTPPAGLEPLGYAGRFYLKELGLYENRRRYYDPLVGRFTQPDPIHLGGGDVNLYAYVGNNPMSWTDPYGTSIAVEYGELLQAVTSYVDALCKYGTCVSTIWKGVVEGVVNLDGVDPGAPIRDCELSFIGDLPTDKDQFKKWLLGKANEKATEVILDELNLLELYEQYSNGDTIKGSVDGCRGITFSYGGSGGGGTPAYGLTK